MRKLGFLLMVIVIFVGIMGCAGKEEKAKEEEKKKESKQTVQKTERTIKVNQNDKFNHSASLKVTQIASEVPEIQDPLVVVYDKEGIMAYKLNSETNQSEIENKLKEKLKAQMPDYEIKMNSDPEWYEQVASLHQDTIDSEGSIVKDLKKTFKNLKDIKK